MTLTKVIHIRDAHMHDNVVLIDRTTKYGNPYVVGKDGSRQQVYELYKNYLLTNKDLCDTVYKELRGKTLACWCKPKKCHGDVIVEYINKIDIDDMFG